MTDHSAPTAPGVLPMRLTPPDFTVARPRTRRTGLATASLVLGVVALVVNVLLVPTILAIVFGAVALSRGTTAGGRAVAGIVLGAVGVLALGVQAAIAIPIFIAAQHAAVGQQVASSITATAAAQGVTLSDVRCPVPRAVTAGATLTCTARTASAEPLVLQVTFTDSRGAFTFRAADAG